MAYDFDYDYSSDILDDIIDDSINTAYTPPPAADYGAVGDDDCDDVAEDDGDHDEAC